MADTTEPTATKGRLKSLANTAECKIFEELIAQVQAASDVSVFAVGGSIPVVALNNQIVCQSDHIQSDEASHQTESAAFSMLRQARKSNKFVGAESAAEVVEVTHAVGDAIGDAIHRGRCDPITIRWDSSVTPGSSYKVTLPCSDAEQSQFERLVKDCQPATFGRGGEEFLDETYRKAGKLDPSNFCSNFNPYAHGIVDIATQALLPDKSRDAGVSGIQVELYKLNIYSSPSGKFKAHVDTPRCKHQIGSLVVCLPSMHQGGQLILRHQDRETNFDWSGEDSRNYIKWAAFYSDCEHEVLEVTSGHRVTLTYNLYATSSPAPSCFDLEQVELYHTLKRLLDQPAFCRNGITLGYNCTHAYAHTSEDIIPTFPAALKGVDKLIYECFSATNLSVRLRPVLGIGSSEESCEEESEDDCSYHDVFASLLGFADLQEYPKLQGAYKPIEGEDSGGTKYVTWKRLNRDQDDTKFAVMANKLEPLECTDDFIDERGDKADIVNSWSKAFSVEKVKWLNERSHEQMALIYGTYGNEPSIATRYSRLVITLDIPPYKDR